MSPISKKILIGVLLLAVGVLVWRWCGQGEEGEEGEEADSEAAERAEQASGEEGESSDSFLAGWRGRAGGASTAGSSIRRMVRGVVTDATSGERVARVDVLFRRTGLGAGLAGAGEESSTSDGDGNFSLELALGRYQVRAIGDGMISVSQPDVRVDRSENAAPLRITVRRLATVAGRVIEQGGGAVGGATVRFVAATPAEKALTKSGLLLDQAPSESDGAFEIDVVPSSSVLIEARSGFLRTRIEVEALSPGERREGVVIELARGVRLRGAVRDRSGNPVANASVTLSAASDGQKKGQTVSANSQGRFELEAMEPGKLILEAHAEGFGETVLPAKQYEAGTAEEVTVTMNNAERLVGVVTDSNGKVVEGARIRCGHYGSKLDGFTTHTDEDGTFEIVGVDNQRHWVSASKSGYGPDTNTKVYPPMELKFVVHSYGALEGSVSREGGGAVSDFVVEIVAAKTIGTGGYKPVGESTQIRDEKGEYRIEDLYPGNYKISIRSDGRKAKSVTVDVPPDGIGRGDAVLAPL